MRKSIFTEYFYLCASIVAGAIICMGAILIVVSSENYKIDQKNRMVSATGAVEVQTKISCSDNGGVNSPELDNIYRNLSDVYDMEFLLYSGETTLAYSESPPNHYIGKELNECILEQIGDNGYFDISTLENYFNETRFAYCNKIKLGETECYLIASADSTPYVKFIARLVMIYFLASTVLILLFVFPVIYFAMRRLLKPVKEMTLAAKRFGEGDFSRKLCITEQNELGFLANSLNEMANSLAVLEENRKSFVSNVSHELKTPMTTIGGFVDGILDGTIPKDMHRHYLHIVSGEVDRLSRLVRSMLNISKYESGEVNMTTESFDIVPLAAKTVFLFEQRISVKDVEIKGLDADRFIVNADKDLIQQVLYNLIENAVKFVNNSGYISFDFSQTEENVSIKIRNSGQGLSENEISRVFDRFYKADESRGIDKTGVGLGLSIVSSIIRLHKGKILVRSEWNEYVEFEFTLEKGHISMKK